jgi:hypothetical protein
LSYSYREQRAQVFTEEGSVAFIAIRDHVKRCLELAGAVTMACATSAARGIDSWTQLACVDRLVELGELVEVEQSRYVAGQDRVFRAPYR